MAGLRERKKQETRERIIREALSLFRRRGYEGTTVADIAEVADISPRTFFSYFDAKEAVVFHDLEEILGSLRARLEERGSEETTFEAFRGWIAEWLPHEELNRSRFQDLLARSVARDLDLPPDALQPRLVGAAAAAALTALDDEEVAADGVDAAMAIVDDALAFLEGGLRALRRR